MQPVSSTISTLSSDEMRVPSLSNKRKNRGFTIIELLIVLVIGGIVLAWAGSKAQDVWQAQKINTAVDDVNSIMQAVREKVGMSTNYASVGTNNYNSYLPPHLRNASGTTNGSSIPNPPWGGSYAVAPTATNLGYTISFSAPAAVGERAANKFPARGVYDTATGNVVVTVNP